MVTVYTGNARFDGMPYVWWQDVSSSFHQRLDFAGPIAAFAATYVAGRLTPPDRVIALPGFARGKFQYAWSQLGPLTLSVMIGYLIGLTPAVTHAMGTATYGRIDAIVVVTGVLGLAAFLVAGWALGVAARTALAAPVSFALAFVATLFGYRDDTFAAVLPVLYVDPGLGSHESTPLLVFRCAFFGLVIISGLVGAASMLGRRSFGRRAPGFAIGLVGPLAVLAVAGTAVQPALFAPDAPPQPVCVESYGVTFCVHPGNLHRLDEMAPTLNPILNRYGRANLPVDRVVDEWLVRAGSIAGETPVATVYLAPDVSVAESATDLTFQLSGSNHCPDSDSDAEPEQTTLARQLADRLNGADLGEILGAFEHVTDTDLPAWIATHRSEIARCELTAGMLPR